ncbi:MAG: hypothetical protein M3N43_00365, partial [Actinomycetota bacterium]|nr:hypothetical protein [Actinomycetota bacterium]
MRRATITTAGGCAAASCRRHGRARRYGSAAVNEQELPSVVSMGHDLVEGWDGMEDDEPALLHEPDLMLAILRAAHRAPAGLDDAMVRLHANLAAAHEP